MCQIPATLMETGDKILFSEVHGHSIWNKNEVSLQYCESIIAFTLKRAMK